MVLNDGVKYSLKYNGEVLAEMGLSRIPNRVNYLLWVGRGDGMAKICWVSPYEAVNLARTLETFMKHCCTYIDMEREGEGV